MSITRILSIHCDGCGDWEYANIAETAADVRLRLAHAGWQVAVVGDGRVRRDFCPKCRGAS